MKNLFQKRKTPSSILGLTLEADRLEGVLLGRSNGSLRLHRQVNAPLALNPFTGDPELAGSEIRNHLEQAGIRERRCVVCLPLSWALTLQVKLPDLPEADLANLLEVEAERGLPYPSESLSIGHSRLHSSDEGDFATLVAVPRNQLSHIEQTLKAARLRPASFSLGINALQNPDWQSSQGVLALAIGESSVDLQVTAAGGIAALRALEEAAETENVQKQLDADPVIREIRITLGQLPPPIRDQVRRVRVFGSGEGLSRFVEDLAPRLEAMNMSLDRASRYQDEPFGKRLPADAEVSSALSLAAGYLTGAKPCLEFLPPKTSSWRQLTTRVSSKKFIYAGATAGSLVALVALAFSLQQWELSKLQSQWKAMEPKAKELKAIQDNIQKYRPWFDDSFQALTVLRQLTTAFPDEGAVTAKTLDIRNLSIVNCTGVAQDNRALLKMLDQLRAMREVSNLKVDQIQGKRPLQFTFMFNWGNQIANEN